MTLSVLSLKETARHAQVFRSRAFLKVHRDVTRAGNGAVARILDDFGRFLCPAKDGSVCDQRFQTRVMFVVANSQNIDCYQVDRTCP